MSGSQPEQALAPPCCGPAVIMVEQAVRWDRMVSPSTRPPPLPWPCLAQEVVVHTNLRMRLLDALDHAGGSGSSMYITRGAAAAAAGAA